MKVLSIILNEKKTEYIKEIDKLKLKEKKLTILNNKISTYYQELFMTFTRRRRFRRVYNQKQSFIKCY